MPGGGGPPKPGGNESCGKVSENVGILDRLKVGSSYHQSGAEKREIQERGSVPQYTGATARDSVPQLEGATKPSSISDRESSSLMRIVLLGFQNTEKSSAGNTILDRRDFESKRSLECVVRQGQVNGRPLTVVEAPGWSVGQTDDSTELLKREIVSSPALCPPGPHAFLIVVPVNISFTEAHRTSAAEHLELLGTRVWPHVMVLFIDGGHLGNRSIEMHIECEGGALQWLLEKCGNRYHVLNSKRTRDGTQVTDLLDKIEKMVDGNNDHHYYIDLNVKEAEKQKKEAMERARQREIKAQKKRVKIREQMGHTQRLSELRLVLMEHGAPGNSSAGNFILGKKEFESRRSAECVKRHGEAAGRKITLVEVPDWCKNREITESCQLLQQEIILSTSLCAPGPHAILLIVRTDVAFRETDRSVIEGHVELLGERVWSRIIVLFTSENYLGDTPIEMHIESEGGALRWLLEKCGHRYHVLNTESRDAGIQVQDLLDKVEEMVAENSSCHYEMDREILKDTEERKRKAKRRAHQRQQNVQKQRLYVRSQIGVLRLVLMGHRTAGKSSAGNTILRREAFELKTAVQAEFKQGTVAGREVTVVESPCWSDPNVQNTAKLYQLEFMHSLFLCHPGPHALLLVIRVDTKYSEMNNRVLEEHLDLLSQRVWKHTIVLFTHEDWLGQTPIEMHIESEGGALHRLLEKCGNRYHVLNTKVKNDGMQVVQLFEKIEEMAAENKHCHYQLDQKILDAAKERRRAEERAKERELRAQRPREENRAKIERFEISYTEEEAVQRLNASVWVQDGGRLSPAFSCLSMKSDDSIATPPNFSSDHYRSSRASSVCSDVSDGQIPHH
ncbi:uncharacterized protein LOC125261895 isoform X3 [Megalobrama amblycephala]|nr:uncharacterized protein LOC125261895 isoform X3 [Megalobrama amblycephala]